MRPSPDFEESPPPKTTLTLPVNTAQKACSESTPTTPRVIFHTVSLLSHVLEAHQICGIHEPQGVTLKAKIAVLPGFCTYLEGVNDVARPPQAPSLRIRAQFTLPLPSPSDIAAPHNLFSATIGV